MSGGRDDVRVAERRRVEPGRHETGDVRHIHHQQGADTVGDPAETLEVDDARVGAGAGHDHLGPNLDRQLLQGVVVDLLGHRIDAVGMDLEPLAAEVDRRAVGQVAAVGQVHAQDLVAHVQDGEVGGHVGLGAGVGLDVHVLGAGEEGQRPILGQSLGHVHELAAAVVALAGQALGVLVGERRALRLHHRGEGVVLAGDQLDLPALAIGLAANGRPQLGVDIGQPGPGDPLSSRDRHWWLLPGLAPARRGCHRHLTRDAIDRDAPIVADQTWRRVRRPNTASGPLPILSVAHEPCRGTFGTRGWAVSPSDISATTDTLCAEMFLASTPQSDWTPSHDLSRVADAAGTPA